MSAFFHVEETYLYIIVWNIYVYTLYVDSKTYNIIYFIVSFTFLHFFNLFTFLLKIMFLNCPLLPILFYRFDIFPSTILLFSTYFSFLFISNSLFYLFPQAFLDFHSIWFHHTCVLLNSSYIFCISCIGKNNTLINTCAVLLYCTMCKFSY